MNTLQIYIISWVGVHEKAVEIADALSVFRANTFIVYSDPDPDFSLQTDTPLLKCSNELFWADKFKTCITHCSADVMLLIHADCQCADWPELVRRCVLANAAEAPIGVWAPLIRGTYFEIERTTITTIPNSPLRLVAQTDGLVFSLKRPVIERMKQARYDDNLYGWGIDWMFITFAFQSSLLVTVDTMVYVTHPVGAGYKIQEAGLQMETFLGQLTIHEWLQFRVLKQYVDRPL